MNLPAGQSVALDPNATYEAEEVALVVFHVTARTFRRRLKKLAAEGFPHPVSRWGTKVWSGQALLAWQNRDRSTGDNIIPISSLLARRAQAAARKGARKPA